MEFHSRADPAPDLCQAKNQRYIDVMAYGLSHHFGSEDDYGLFQSVSRRIPNCSRMRSGGSFEWRTRPLRMNTLAMTAIRRRSRGLSHRKTLRLTLSTGSGLDCSLTAMQSDFKRIS